MILLYSHSGSYNHGCEALIRSVIAMFPAEKIIIQSNNPSEDIEFGIDEIAEVVPLGKRFSERSRLHLIIARAFKLLFHTEFFYWYGINKPLRKYLKKINCALSIGGDNYCYTINGMLEYQNRYFKSKNIKTVLFGASINPEVLSDRTVRDLKRYDLITARESITYEALKNCGLNNIERTVDTAFFLEKAETELPAADSGRKMIGINASPLVTAKNKDPDLVFNAYRRLIEWIISNTDSDVLLIPHVTVRTNNDLDVLERLAESLDSSRIKIVSQDKKLNCMQLKQAISQCEFMVAARTHASIAAYSSAVPCLVIGYSVKSRGIAKDLFDSIDDYVLDADRITEENDLLDRFLPLYNSRGSIRDHLQTALPAYKEGYYSGLSI